MAFDILSYLMGKNAAGSGDGGGGEVVIPKVKLGRIYVDNNSGSLAWVRGNYQTVYDDSNAQIYVGLEPTDESYGIRVESGKNTLLYTPVDISEDGLGTPEGYIVVTFQSSDFAQYATFRSNAIDIKIMGRNIMTGEVCIYYKGSGRISITKSS